MSKYGYKNEIEDTRRDFIRKVYGILAVQLLVTAGVVLLAFWSEGFRDFIKENGWMEILCLCVAVIVEIVIVAKPEEARKVPNNYYLLYLFTFCESYIVASMCVEFDPMIVF